MAIVTDMKWYLVVFICIPWLLVMLSIFSCACAHFDDLFGKVSISDANFFHWVIFCYYYIVLVFKYILLIILFWDCFPIFSYSVDYLFILLTVLFLLRRSFLVWYSTICWFCFTCFVLLALSKKSSSKEYQWTSHLCFLLGFLWYEVLCLSLNHYESIFASGVR